MSRGHTVGLVRILVFAASVGTLAAAGTYTVRSSWSLPALAVASDAQPSRPQVANRLAKTDRLAVLLASADPRAGYELAAVGPDLDATPVPRLGLPAPSEAATTEPAPEAVPTTEPTGSIGVTAVNPAATVAVPLPPKRPKLALPPPPPSGLLNEAQIAGIRDRLRLTAEQAQYWPAVEAALRDVVKTLRFSGGVHAHSSKTNIDVNSPEVQRLIWAAVPLLMRLREDQKHEVRKLARVIGLESVASQI